MNQQYLQSLRDRMTKEAEPWIGVRADIIPPAVQSIVVWINEISTMLASPSPADAGHSEDCLTRVNDGDPRLTPWKCDCGYAPADRGKVAGLTDLLVELRPYINNAGKPYLEAAITRSMGHAPEPDGQCINCLELTNALTSAVDIARQARMELDRDHDVRALKILMALSGYAPKYRSDTDRIHDVLKRAPDRRSPTTKPGSES